jgi:multidrug resistance efflux pump
MEMKAMAAGLWRWIRTAFGTIFRSARFWIVLLLAIIVVLVIYYALANKYTPFTNDAYVQAFVIQVAPQVDGQIVAVHVRENESVAKGTLLFEIDPRPYEHKVRKLEAALVKTTQLVAQMESELQAARADETRLIADEAFALAVHDQESEIFKKGSTTERKYLDVVQKHKAAVASVERAKAVVRQREQALQAMIGDEHAEISEVKAQLATARLHLEWTRVYAPADVHITNLQLQVGSYATIGKPVMACIDKERWWIVANFRENNLEDVRPGQRVEVSFKSMPGRFFAGTVQSVGWGVGQGQGVPSGELPNVRSMHEWLPLAQRFQVRIVVPLPAEMAVRVGATASVTIYTTSDSALNPIGEFWQRLASWVYYLR